MPWTGRDDDERGGALNRRSGTRIQPEVKEARAKRERERGHDPQPDRLTDAESRVSP